MTAEKPARIVAKDYKCRRCGHVMKIETNHYGPCWSFDRVNVCPKCPPWAKYMEFGGQTIWDCQEKENP